MHYLRETLLDSRHRTQGTKLLNLPREHRSILKLPELNSFDSPSGNTNKKAETEGKVPQAFRILVN